MEGTERRERIIDVLNDSGKAVSGGALAKKLGVSRQVIVQDVALLRAGNNNIVSTPKGYMMITNDKIRRRFHVYHEFEDLEKELDIFVDAGARVVDVIVEHPIYGEIKGKLDLSSRRDVKDFMNKVGDAKEAPLMSMSGGVHWHTIEADSSDKLDEIEEALRKAGFLRE